MARRVAAPATLTAHHDCEFREVLDRVGQFVMPTRKTGRDDIDRFHLATSASSTAGSSGSTWELAERMFCCGRTLVFSEPAELPHPRSGALSAHHHGHERR